MSKNIIICYLLICSGIFINSYPADAGSQTKTKRAVISGIEIESYGVGYGDLSINKNLSGSIISLKGQKIDKAIFAHAPSRIKITNNKRFNYFKATCGIEDAVATKGSVRFLVLADGKVVFISKLIKGGESPVSITVDIRGSHTIELIADDVENNYYDHSVWGFPELLFDIPDGSACSNSQRSFTNTAKNLMWDTGQKEFPNKDGLFVWHIIVGIVYCLILAMVYAKRKQILSNILNYKTIYRRPEFYVLTITTILTTWVFSGFWESGLPASWDAGQHYLRCLITKDLFLSNFQIDGWSPYWYLGVQQYLFYSPFLFLLVALFHFFTFQLIPLIVCFKLFFFGIYFLLPFVCYWMLQQFKIGPFPASIAALGVPSFSAIHGFGIEGLFIPGLFTQGFGVLLFCVALGFFRRIAESGLDIKKSSSLAFLIGIMFLSHIITSIYFIFSLSIYILLHLSRKGVILPIIFAVIAGGLMAGCAIWPTFYFRDLMGPEVGWGDIQFFESILHGSYFSSGLINVFALAGLFITPFLKRKDLLFIALLAIVTYLLASGRISIHAGIMAQVSRQIFKSRTFPYLAIFFIIFTGVFYHTLIDIISKAMTFTDRNTKDLTQKFMSPFLILCIILLVLATSGIKLISLKPLIKLDSDFVNYKRESFIDAFHWIKYNTPENIVVTFDDCGKAIDDIGFNQFASQINIHADRYTLQGNQLELTKAHNETVAAHFADWPPEEIHKYLKRYNVSYLILWNDDAIDNLSSWPVLFQSVYRNAFVVILQVRGHDFRYIANDDIHIHEFYFSPENIRWRFSNNGDQSHVVTAIAFHPDWNLSINGFPSKIDKTPDNLISFQVPGKVNEFNVELKFQKSISEYFFYSLSFLMAITLIYLLTGKSDGFPK